MADTLFRRFSGNTRSFRILTVAEAEQEGIDYVYWKEATEPGQWVITDDGYVCELVKRTGPHREKGRGLARYHVTLPFCRSWVTGVNQLLYESYRSDDMQPWLRDELEKPRFKNALSVYASLIVNKGYPLLDDDLKLVGTLYRPDQKIPEATFLRVMKNHEAKSMLAAEIKSLLASQGITEKDVVSMFMDAFETAKQGGQSSTMRGVAKDLAEMLQMEPQKSQTPVEHEVDWSKLLGNDEPLGLDAPDEE